MTPIGFVGGSDLKKIQGLMGHNYLTTTALYVESLSPVLTEVTTGRGFRLTRSSSLWNGASSTSCTWRAHRSTSLRISTPSLPALRRSPSVWPWRSGFPWRSLPPKRRVRSVTETDKTHTFYRRDAGISRV